ncbi:MAG: PTS cellobiose transporter subunit IIC [Fusobacteriaceae bacterium]
MSKGFQFMEEKLLPLAAKVGSQKHLSSIRDGLMVSIPLVMIGSLFLMIAFFPIQKYLDFMGRIFGASWQDKFLYPVGVTFDLIAVIALIAITYRLAEKNSVDKLSACAISVASFFLVTPYSIKALSGENVRGISLAFTGSKGLFVAIIIAIVSTEIFTFVTNKKLVIKMPDSVPMNVSKSFAALIPGFIIIIFFWLLKLLFEATSFESIHGIVEVVLMKPLSLLGGTYAGAIIAVFLAQLLWLVGIQGQALVFGLMTAIWLPLLDANRLAFQQGLAIPNIINSQFFDIFYSLGGSGATLGLAILLLFRAKSAQLKEIGKLSIGPGLFNINEPIIFGIPIIMNPLMMIPFLLVPIVVITTSYFAMEFGLVAKTIGIMIPWTTPPIISGYLVTGGKISGSVIQLINICLSVLIYYPFFVITDRKNLELEKNNK